MQAIDLLIKRQSTPLLQAPAPSQDDLAIILQSGMRVPDHGGIKPWHFTIATEQSLHTLSRIFVEAMTATEADKAKLTKTRKMAFRAPLVITVSTKIVEHEKVPKQEQIIAAGCAVHAMQMAAVALGYGAIWRSGALSYDSSVKQALDIEKQDEIVGFLYIGTACKTLPLKATKDLEGFVTYL